MNEKARPRAKSMNKTELIERVANEAGVTKSEASKIIDATLKVISYALSNGDSIHVEGFGSFKVFSPKSRTGRNPRAVSTIKNKVAKKPTSKLGTPAAKKAMLKGPTGGGGPGKKK